MMFFSRLLGPSRRTIFILSLTALLGILPIGGQVGFAGESKSEADPNRAVQLDWEPIAGAQNYEVEWFEAAGAVCDEKVGGETVAKAKWSKRLPAGQYCLHLRGVSEDGKPGQWTEMERFAVAPKAPSGLTRVGASFEWEWKKVPYAKSYLVEVTDPSGRIIYKDRTKSNSVKVPDAIMQARAQSSGLGEYEISVKTEVDGLPASQPTFDAFPRSGSKLAAAASNAAKDGKGADRAPAQQKLEARIYDGPDWRLKLTLGKGDWDYRSSAKFTQDISRSQTNSGQDRISIIGEYFSTGSWGGWALAEQRKATLSEKSVSATVLSAGVHYQLWRDKKWGPKLSVGLGPRYQLIPIQVSGSSSGTSSSSNSNNSSASSEEAWFIGVQTFGLEARMTSTIALTENWAAAASLRMSWAPEQEHLGENSSFGQSGSEIEIGPVYRFNESFWLRAGYFVYTNSLSGRNSDTYVKLADSGPFLELTARTGSPELRSPASILTYRDDASKLWRVAVAAPLGSRTVTFMHLVDPTGTDPQAYRLTGAFSTIGVEASAERRWAPGSRLAGGMNFTTEKISYPSRTASDSALSAYGAYDILFASRIDTRVQGIAGLGVRSSAIVLPPDSTTGTTVSGTTNEYASSLQAVESILGFDVQRHWSPRFGSNLVGSAAMPFLTPGASLKGTSYHALIGINVGYKLTPTLSVTGGYEIQQHRIVLRSTTTTSTGSQTGDSDMSYSQNQLRLGLQMNW